MDNVSIWYIDIYFPVNTPKMIAEYDISSTNLISLEECCSEHPVDTQNMQYSHPIIRHIPPPHRMQIWLPVGEQKAASCIL